MEIIGDTEIIKDEQIAYIAVLKGDKKIRCYVLQNGERVLNADDLNNFFGGKDWKDLIQNRPK